MSELNLRPWLHSLLYSFVSFEHSILLPLEACQCAHHLQMFYGFCRMIKTDTRLSPFSQPWSSFDLTGHDSTSTSRTTGLPAEKVTAVGLLSWHYSTGTHYHYLVQLVYLKTRVKFSSFFAFFPWVAVCQDPQTCGRRHLTHCSAVFFLG